MKYAVSFLLVTVLVGLVKSDTPTLLPADPFDALADAAKLRKAMVGWGTTEKDLVDVLCHRDVEQRMNVSHVYVESYGQTLEKSLKSELSGNLRQILVSLVYTTEDYLGIELNRVLGKSELDSVLEVLISRSMSDIASINAAFEARFGSSLISQIEKKASGSVKTLLSQLAEGKREESETVDETLVLQDVEALFNAGPAIPGTDDAVYINIFTSRSWIHLRAVFKKYIIKHARKMENVIKSEFTGDMQTFLLSMVTYADNHWGYLAQRLFYSMEGMGTSNNKLIRLVISRCEMDLGDIKIEYEKKFKGRTLVNDIKGDCSGYYKDSLLALVGA